MLDQTIEPHYTDRVVAFVDILGFRQKIEKKPELQDKILAALLKLDNIRSENKLHKKFVESLGAKTISPYKGIKQEEISTFSDHIVVSIPWKQTNRVASLLNTLISIHETLLSVGLPLRGGVSKGWLFHQDNIVFGDAFLRAYDLESKVAVYPRIVFDDIVINESQMLTSKLSNESESYEKFMLEKYIRKDFDGCYFLDHLNAANTQFDDISWDYQQHFEKVREIIIDMLESQNMGILAKGRWFNMSLKTAKYIASQEIPL